MAFCWTLKRSHCYLYHCVYMLYTISSHHLPYCPLQSGVKWWISRTLQHLIAERRSWQDGRCCMWQTGRSSLTCGNMSDSPQTSDLLIVSLHVKSHSTASKNANASRFQCVALFLDRGVRSNQNPVLHRNMSEFTPDCFISCFPDI